MLCCNQCYVERSRIAQDHKKNHARQNSKVIQCALMLMSTVRLRMIPISARIISIITRNTPWLPLVGSLLVKKGTLCNSSNKSILWMHCDKWFHQLSSPTICKRRVMALTDGRAPYQMCKFGITKLKKRDVVKKLFCKSGTVEMK